eukprot:4370411-Pleurochrysis_carterae.AAC.3
MAVACFAGGVDSNLVRARSRSPPRSKLRYVRPRHKQGEGICQIQRPFFARSGTEALAHTPPAPSSSP